MLSLALTWCYIGIDVTSNHQLILIECSQLNITQGCERNNNQGGVLNELTTKKPMKNDIMETPTVRYRYVAKVQQPPTRAVKTPPIMQLVKRIAPVRSSLINNIAPCTLNMCHVCLAAFTKLFPWRPTCISKVHPTQSKHHLINECQGAHEINSENGNSFWYQVDFFFKRQRWWCATYLDESPLVEVFVEKV